jgi:hypothetical protein
MALVAVSLPVDSHISLSTASRFDKPKLSHLASEELANVGLASATTDRLMPKSDDHDECFSLKLVSSRVGILRLACRVIFGLEG